MNKGPLNINRELEAIQKALETFKDGASLEMIKEASGLRIALRILQRRLDKPREISIVRASGKTRSTLYHLVKPPVQPKQETTEDVAVSIPLSQKARKLIRAKAMTLPDGDQSKFIETVDTELLSLHEGNFARHWIRPSEFARWKEVWTKQ